MDPGHVLTLDVGNSGLHAVWWPRGEGEPDEWRSPHDGPADWPGAWVDRGSPEIRGVGVSPSAEELWARRVASAWREAPRWLGHGLACPLVVAEGVVGAGMDRLAAAAGAWSSAAAPVLVVDAGTALTIDLVDADGVFRGGAILPGLETANRSLEESAVALERADLAEGPPVWPARTTEEAIRAGVLTQAGAAVATFQERARLLCGCDPALWLTGGGSVLLAPHLGGEVHVDPLMVHRGLLAAGA